MLPYFRILRLFPLFLFVYGVHFSLRTCPPVWKLCSYGFWKDFYASCGFALPN